MYNKIVLFIPHSASLSDEYKSSWTNMQLFTEEVDKWTDWYTNTIFDTFEFDTTKLESIIVPVSRYFCDCERLSNDPLETEGRGIYYTQCHNGVKRIVNKREEIRSHYIYDHWNQQLNKVSGPDSLIIDCHSFPSDLSDVDVCIGFNDDSTKPSDEVLDTIKLAFEHNGYTVAFNNPFSNAKCGAVGSHSVMIELNKKIYMNENTFELDESAYKIHNLLVNLYRKLLR